MVIIAVDGGNSKTDVVVLDPGGTVLARGSAGAFLPQSQGVAAAVDVVEEAIRQALGPDAAPPYADLLTAYLAGADLPVEEEALAAEFRARGTAGEVVVANDSFALLRSGASGPSGVAVVCGAGINAVGVSPAGEVARFPSLGKLSGDWGGGGGLSEEALWHAVRGEDGRGAPTALTPAIAAHFGTRTVEEAVIGLHVGRIPAERLTRFAPVVFEAAEAGDGIALGLVTRLADEVVVMAEVCLRRLGLLRTPTEVVLGGGVLRARIPLLSRMLDERFGERAPLAKQVIPRQPPIVGAALNALDRVGAGEAAEARLRASF
ncbi:BadF/BadG/BcrA/BcrD ATPase family protein [Nonomuraea sp. NPDC049725]|uniref:N-acetylglucosamine kinase n=1 Tax=Nonomuraea sp. NPDC049725 TaxID=3154508 RepID=UPI00343E1755